MLKENAWDCMMVVFNASDLMQHYFWRFIDVNHPAYDKEDAKIYGEVIYDAYRQIDKAIGEILEKVGEDTKVMILSDHGFGLLYKEFYLNRWLMENGLLKLNGGRRYSLTVTATSVERILHRLRLGFVARLLPEGIKSRRLPVVRKKAKPYHELIDWQRTKAYATSYAMSINLKGREPQGIVEPGDEYESLVKYIKSELCNVKDPHSGQMIIEKVVEKKELYNGFYVEHAPDILLFLKIQRTP